MVSRKEWYQRVNAVWPTPVPGLTPEEAVRATKKLWRHFRKRKLMWPVEITSGRRYTWAREGTMYVNPEHGWSRFIHDLSHYFHRRAQFGLDPEARVGPHHKDHAKLELRMRNYVLKQGWLAGKLKSRPKPERMVLPSAYHKLTKMDELIERWERKQKRAHNALKKLIRQRKWLVRKLEKNEQPTQGAN